jgi:hypothetical protein
MKKILESNLNILFYLDYKSIINCSMVCKSLYEIIEIDNNINLKIWESLYKKLKIQKEDEEKDIKNFKIKYFNYITFQNMEINYQFFKSSTLLIDNEKDDFDIKTEIQKIISLRESFKKSFPFISENKEDEFYSKFNEVFLFWSKKGFPQNL